jgi:hypothetical protein
MRTHNFEKSLARSHSFADADWWEPVYREAFSNFKMMIDQRQDGWHQRAGIDRQVILNDSTVLKIDEKADEAGTRNIFLEYWSDRDRKVPGWVAKDLSCDYIAYALIATQRCYLLPFHTLRRAWRLNRRHWVDTYGAKHIANEGYWTVGVPVPIPVLFPALTDAMTIQWNLNSSGLVSARQISLFELTP